MSAALPLPSAHWPEPAWVLAVAAVSRSERVRGFQLAVVRTRASQAAEASSPRPKAQRCSPASAIQKRISDGSTNSGQGRVRTFVVLDAFSLVGKALVFALVAGDDFNRVRRRRWRYSGFHHRLLRSRGLRGP